MALDSRQKRAAVIGAARIWYRNPHPSSVNAGQRAAISQTYPVAAFAEAAIFIGDTAGIESLMFSGHGIESEINASAGITSEINATRGAKSLI